MIGIFQNMNRLLKEYFIFLLLKIHFGIKTTWVLFNIFIRSDTYTCTRCVDPLYILILQFLYSTSFIYTSVFLRGSKSHTDRILDINAQTLLNELPNGNQFRITSNGRIVKKSQETSQQRAPRNKNRTRQKLLGYSPTY